MQNEVTALDLAMNFFFLWLEVDINWVVATEKTRGICSLMYVSYCLEV